MTDGKYRDPEEQRLAAQRPQHPDFWVASRVLIAHDDTATAKGIPAAVEGLIDPEVLAYMAEQRVMRAVQLIGLPRELAPVMQSLWMDSFTAGIAFAQEKARRKEDGE